MEIWIHIGMRVAAMIYIHNESQSGIYINEDIIAALFALGYFLSGAITAPPSKKKRR